jgi:prophage regulatory protein
MAVEKRLPIFLREKEVLDAIQYTRVGLANLEANGHFPRRVKLGPRRIAFLKSEVDAWIEARLAERGAGSEAATAA